MTVVTARRAPGGGLETFPRYIVYRVQAPYLGLDVHKDSVTIAVLPANAPANLFIVSCL